MLEWAIEEVEKANSNIQNYKNVIQLKISWTDLSTGSFRIFYDLLINKLEERGFTEIRTMVKSRLGNHEINLNWKEKVITDAAK